jgi:hypothetical protein
MEHLIREFGAWLKQGFGWLVDVIVFGCLWGISQVALGVILFSAAVVSGVFASAGLVAAVAIWVMSNINLAAR